MSGKRENRELGRLLREAARLLESADLHGANEVLEKASAEALAARDRIEATPALVVGADAEPIPSPGYPNREHKEWNATTLRADK